RGTSRHHAQRDDGPAEDMASHVQFPRDGAAFLPRGLSAAGPSWTSAPFAATRGLRGAPAVPSAPPGGGRGVLVASRPMRFSLVVLVVVSGLVLFTGLSHTGFLELREASDAHAARAH